MQDSSINCHTFACALIRCLLLFSLITNAWAEGSAPTLVEARRLLDAGQAEQSATLLEDLLPEYAGNTEFDYLLGSAWLRSGQAAKAMFAFERILMSEPDNIGTRLKMARISLDRNDTGFAYELLLPISAQNLDSVQQKELADMQVALSEAARKIPFSMHSYLLVSLGGDDNVTSGPEQNSLIIPALGTTPTSLGTATRDKDMTGSIEGGMALQKTLDADIWLTGEGSFQQGFNRSRTDMTEGVANFSLGLIKRNGRAFLGAALLAQDYQISHASYRTLSGARLSWTHSFANNSSLAGYVQQLALSYPSNSTDNATRTLFGITRENSLIGDRGSLQYGAYGGKEVAQNSSRAYLGFQMVGGSLGASLSLGKYHSLSVGTIYESRNYDSVDALYLISRIESTLTVGMAADYQLTKHWHLIPRYTYIRNVSNTELYDYTRNTFVLQLRRNFDNGKN